MVKKDLYIGGPAHVSSAGAFAAAYIQLTIYRAVARSLKNVWHATRETRRGVKGSD